MCVQLAMVQVLSCTSLGVCLLAGAAVCCGQSAPATQLTAQEIMARVAANQDKAEAERAHYVYVQHTRMASQKGHTILCEELTDYRITPSQDGFHDELIKLDGRLRVKGKYVSYTTLKPKDDENVSDKVRNNKNAKDNAAKVKEENDKPAKDKAAKDTNAKANDAKDKAAQPEPAKGKQVGGKDDSDAISIQIGDDALDRDLVENMRSNLMHDKSKDGINAHLFPLTTKEQADYRFELAGRERMNGRAVYHVIFRPKDKDDFGWKGDAYIDEQAFQPVEVTTVMSRKIPFGVRTLLGTNVPGLGFTVVYAPQADGVWFPTSFSSEFKIHVLYFFHRDIVLNAENRDFEKTHVSSRILEGVTPVEPENSE